MTRIYHDEDADLAHLAGLTVGVLGYGNQGRAQALNLCDSGCDVLVGCPRDDYFKRACEDGFDVVDVAEASRRADVLLVLIPDEIQAAVYQESIAPGLGKGKTLVFASGYNIHFGLIEAPAGTDVVLVAPRMIGDAVRTRFVEGAGFPCLVAVGQDAGGHALDTALAIARGIGGTAGGAYASSFEEETLVDLFAEQFLWAGFGKLSRVFFDTLVEAGCAPETVATEMYLSGEMVQIARAMLHKGFFRQLDLHSQTSQYGQLSRGEAAVGDVSTRARAILDDLRNGAFAAEWASEQAAGKPELARLKAEAFAHPINDVEDGITWRPPDA